jgi:hypothetical protein
MISDGKQKSFVILRAFRNKDVEPIIRIERAIINIFAQLKKSFFQNIFAI